MVPAKLRKLRSGYSPESHLYETAPLVGRQNYRDSPLDCRPMHTAQQQGPSHGVDATTTDSPSILASAQNQARSLPQIWETLQLAVRTVAHQWNLNLVRGHPLVARRSGSSFESASHKVEVNTDCRAFTLAGTRWEEVLQRRRWIALRGAGKQFPLQTLQHSH
jgi:hypothetical protein